jgi:hypothetical protein
VDEFAFDTSLNDALHGAPSVAHGMLSHHPPRRQRAIKRRFHQLAHGPHVIGDAALPNLATKPRYTRRNVGGGIANQGGLGRAGEAVPTGHFAGSYDIVDRPDLVVFDRYVAEER